MTKVILAICFVFSFTSSFAQQADMRVGELLNQSDWFTLAEEYPVIKASVQTDCLKLIAEIMINNNFNRPEQASKKIFELLEKHPSEIGESGIFNMIQLATIIDGERGHYASAADGIKGLIDAMKAAEIKEGLELYEYLYHNYNHLRDYPAPAIIQPNKNIEIPMTIEKVRNGSLMYVPVVVHQKTYKFIFDTGCGRSLVSEKFAKEMGIKIIQDSIVLNAGMQGEGYVKNGYLDSMQIGDIVFKNALLLVKKPDAKVDSVFEVDAVLGMDFMKLVKEIQIYPKEQKIVFPAEYTPLPSTGRNLLLTNNKPILKAYSKDKRLLFFFDTGNSKADLFYPYYLKYKEDIDQIATKDTITGGGFGFVRSKEILLMPAVSFKIGDTPIEMKNIRVHPTPDNDQTQDDANMGMDLIKLFSKVTINLKDMFVDLRNEEGGTINDER